MCSSDLEAQAVSRFVFDQEHRDHFEGKRLSAPGVPRGPLFGRTPQCLYWNEETRRCFWKPQEAVVLIKGSRFVVLGIHDQGIHSERLRRLQHAVERVEQQLLP